VIILQKARSSWLCSRLHGSRWWGLVQNVPREKNDVYKEVILVYFQIIYEKIRKSSPSLPLLRFIGLLLEPVRGEKVESRNSGVDRRLNLLLLEFVVCFSQWIPHNLNEDAFKVLNSLLYCSRFSLKFEHIQAVVKAILDKYTMKSAHSHDVIHFIIEQDVVYKDLMHFKESRDGYVDWFIKILVDEKPNVEWLLNEPSQEDFELFVNKNNLFILLINNLDDQHGVIFDNIVK
jgi:hypothetical protein